MDVKTLLVPDFAQDALSRNLLPIGDFLNFRSISKVLSLNDIVTCVCLQEYWTSTVGDGDNAAMSTKYDLLNIWAKSCISDEHKLLLNAQVMTLVEAECNKEMGQKQNGVSLRYFQELQDQEDQLVPEVRELGPGVYGVIIKADMPKATVINKNFLRLMMEKLSVYMHPEEIAHTHWFDLYLRSLSYM